MKNVCIIGLGYIGLPTAALLASKNYKAPNLTSLIKESQHISCINL